MSIPNVRGLLPAETELPDEVVTRAIVRDVDLGPDAGVLALITLDNGRDHTKPNTFGIRGLLSLNAALDAIEERAGRGEIAAVLGLPARMRLTDFSFAGVDPEVMGVGPIPATETLLARNSLTIDDIGLIEINEAFAVQVLSFLDHFKIDDDDPRVNPWGGAIALGHPLASSGVRLMMQLAREFAEHPEVRYGLTTMCIGMGMGATVLWENTGFEKNSHETMGGTK